MLLLFLLIRVEEKKGVSVSHISLLLTPHLCSCQLSTMSKLFVPLLLSSVTVHVEGSRSYRNELIEQDPDVIGEVVKTPRPHSYIKPEDLPESWDYRPLGLLTTDLNQHIPTYCGEKLWRFY